MNKPSFFFLHVSKNAGTSIEEFFKSEGILLGRFDPFYSNHNINWHTPPSTFRKLLKDSFKDATSGKTIFIVHRSPFHRVLSEMNCKWGNPKKEVIQGSKRRFNVHLSQYLIGVILRRLHNWPYLLLVRMSLLIPLGRDHWIPQSHYFKNISISPTQIQIIPFESLHQGVSELLGKQVILPRMNEQSDDFKHRSTSINSLNKALIALAYADDMINHKRLLEVGKNCVCLSQVKLKHFSFNRKWSR